jgi:hypothetical protein
MTLAMDDIWLWSLMPHGFIENKIFILGINFVGQKNEKNP